MAEGGVTEGGVTEGAREVQILAPTTRFVFRGGTAARVAAGAAFGLVLPETRCRATIANGRAALWLGPDEHLLLAPAGDLAAAVPAGVEPATLAAELEAALAATAHSLVEVSQRQVALRVSGPRAAALLNTGCPLDLDPAQFPIGMCLGNPSPSRPSPLGETGLPRRNRR